MASTGWGKTQPSVAWLDEKTYLTADHQIKKNSSSYDGSEARGNDDQTNALLTSDCDELNTITLESDLTSVQPVFDDALEIRELMRKLC